MELATRSKGEMLAAGLGRGRFSCSARIAVACALSLCLMACNATPVLHAKFDTEAIGAPPALNQVTGTVTTKEGAGSVRVAVSPVSSSAGNNWLKISHPTKFAPETAMRAQFDAFHGAGEYGLLMAMVIAKDTGPVTLQLEPFVGTIESSLNFLHLDFMPENDVRVNDNDGDRFGAFPRDKAFLVSVKVDSTVSPAKGTITPAGDASGSKDIELPPAATQFGAVRIWMGHEWVGTFFVDDVLVTRAD